QKASGVGERSTLAKSREGCLAETTVRLRAFLRTQHPSLPATASARVASVAAVGAGAVPVRPYRLSLPSGQRRSECGGPGGSSSQGGGCCPLWLLEPTHCPFRATPSSRLGPMCPQPPWPHPLIS